MRFINRFSRILNLGVTTNLKKFKKEGGIIGENCIIGAGAIVTKDIPSNTVAVGVPARVIESIDEYRSKVVEKGIHSKRMSKKEKKIFLKKLFESNSDKKIE